MMAAVWTKGPKSILMVLFVASVLQTTLAGSATNEPSEDLKLRPPRAAIPPSFWEQNGNWIVPMAIAGLLAIALLVWYFTRPRPAAEIPPEVRARNELEALSKSPVDREVLCRTSQVLKAYLAEVFGLPKEEMTTAEFCKAFSAKTQAGEALLKNVCDFLRRSDQMKFAPGPVPSSGSVVPATLALIDQAESRRAELCAAQASAPGSPVAVPEVAKT